MKREPHRKKIMKVDLSKPLDLSTVSVDDGTCFGKMWDLGERECQGCASSDLCGIVFESGTLKPAVEKMDEAHGPFLDQAAMQRVTDATISKKLKKEGSMTVDVLIAFLLDEANSDDRPSAIERIKRYKATGLIRISQGIAHWTGK